MGLIARKANCFSNNWIGEWYEKDKVDAVLAQKDEEIRKLKDALKKANAALMAVDKNNKELSVAYNK